MLPCTFMRSVFLIFRWPLFYHVYGKNKTMEQEGEERKGFWEINKVAT